jgi:transposase
METVTISKAEYDTLKAEHSALEAERDALENQYDALKSANARLEQQVSYLLEQMRLARRRQFGTSSEKSEYDAEQLNLFNEAEFFAAPKPDVVEPELELIERHYRRKRRELPGKLPEDLPVEVVEHVLPEDERICLVCEGPLHVMGKETVRRELKLIPAKAVVVEHVRCAYACRCCERTDIAVPVVKAPMPKPVIPGSFASPEAIAHILTQKFVMGLPLYRQEQDWKRQGIELHRETMSNWLLKATEAYLEPLYEALKQRLLSQRCLHADETGLQVLREPGKAAQSKSYMWLYRTSGDADYASILYEYQSGRGAAHIKRFLGEWKGYLHTDGYDAYHSLEPQITVVGCWAHARRKFDEAIKVLPEKSRKDSGAMEGMVFCDRLFALEKQLADLSQEQRHEARHKLARPILDEFRTWLLRQNVGKSAFGKAVTYTLAQWKYLERYLLDGRLEISNNRAERSIKPFVIGRKNFLFANTPRGAKASAVMYSIVETAKENGLNPYEYLVFLFREMPGRAPDAPTEDFLPGGALIPVSCRCSLPNSDFDAWDVV